MAKLINTASLANLANPALNAQLAALGVTDLTSELQTAMGELAAERRKEDVKAAASEVLNLNANANETLTNNVATINALQEQINAFTKVNEAIARARRYGQSSDNWLPLAAAIGINAPAGTPAELKKVPADFEVAPAAAPAAV